MNKLTRQDAHLVLAAIRVLDHLNRRPPTPAEMADLLQVSESQVRLQLSVLHEMGAAVLVDSAYETHAEIKDHTLIDSLDEDEGPAISEDLAAFDKIWANPKIAHFGTSPDAAKTCSERLLQDPAYREERTE